MSVKITFLKIAFNNLDDNSEMQDYFLPLSLENPEDLLCVSPVQTTPMAFSDHQGLQ